MSDWKKEFGQKFGVMDEKDGGWTYPPSPTNLESFIEQLLAAQRKQIDKEWLHGLRCHNCGHKKDNQQVSDLCIRCFETA